jgi:glycosyltransferase involved in cell wall biosynthesis
MNLQTLPAISVVIPLYNKEKYLRRAVESVLSQGAAVREVIVVDDGSTDNGPAQLESLGDSRVRLIRQPNGGVSAARNAGIEAATGEYVAFLDADDAWLPGFVDELLALMQQFPQASLHATSYSRVWPDGRRQDAYLPEPLGKLQRQLIANPFYVWARSAFFSISSSACVRRKVLLEHGIRFPVGESQGEDQDVIFQLMEAGGLAFSPKALMEYSQAVPNSLYSSLPEQVPPCYMRLLQRTRQANYPAQHRRGAQRVVAVNYLNVARTLMAKGKRREAAALIFSRDAMHHPTYWMRTVSRMLLPTGMMK